MPKINEGVFFIQGQDDFMPDSHTYIVGRPSSNDLSLVDPGLVGKGDYKIGSITKAGFELEDIKRIILTHTHFDHIGCLREIQKRIPWAELWVHTLEGEPVEKGDERTVYGIEMFQQVCQSQYGIQPGAFTFPVHRKLEGGTTLRIGGMAWEVIHIPGHSLGSIGLYDSTEKVLIPGDVIYADYAIGRFDLFGADGPELKKSLMKLAQKKVEVLLPGHNRVVTNLPEGAILETLKQWESYLV